MARLLYVEASPRKRRSASIDTCRAFLAAYRQNHPDDEIETLDIWDGAYPAFDGEALAAKYAGIEAVALSSEQAACWEAIGRLAAPFLRADKLLMGVPLWNFGIPYRLKHLIDLISQDGVLFTFDGMGFAGLAQVRKALVVYARGLDYADGLGPQSARFDFQKPYVEAWLGLIGVPEIQDIVVEKTLLGSAVDLASRANARRAAVQLASRF